MVYEATRQRKWGIETNYSSTEIFSECPREGEYPLFSKPDRTGRFNRFNVNRSEGRSGSALKTACAVNRPEPA
ncbi:hypothetical protein M5K25_023346 [Dendrobium thyrsiflorum]|uniref:Uncharacterized protein n=1 Tax=Dendrobium thyrsiflorum TaxID=117978 RepID=A0ABD0U7V5_DENTH